ncbi:DNA polymerase IV [Clostridium intestinale]|uniref:DNA polymerase IV n=1 Tax=Clostridium intestinale TaxID=36845 RepID=A0A7D6ZVW5_9CLOT|nr:DNA polymerase IV [Clostridium intestinale]QLY78694.1 DNA polymerase IV [Clostridium intestinale]
MNKKIIHVDMDAFFASVEVMDNPKLKGKPVIVGGTSERGVVATCSYEARAFGVHSAMPLFMAKEKCPHGVYLPVRYGRYKEISRKVFSILEEITSIIEPVSIDEAYLDVTNSNLTSMEAALYIKKAIRRELGITISAGISYNKFLAKIASEWNKPDGIKEITEDMVPEILFPLSVSKIHGLGEKSVKKLNNIGIFRVKDLYALPNELFTYYFGKYGDDIYNRIRGIDNREVKINHDRKSIGKETTLRKNTNDREELLEYIDRFSKEISDILIDRNLSGRTLTIKYKTWDFKSHTKSKTLMNHVDKYDEIFKNAVDILTDELIEEELRLIGLSISSLKENKIQQLRLF